MEKIPGFRIVGGASEEVKNDVRKEMEYRLTDHIDTLPERTYKELEKLEYPKSPEEVELIAFANEETNRLRIEAGVEPYEIPSENTHIVPQELYKQIAPRTGVAACNFERQIIIVNARESRANPVLFGSVVFHETLHLKGYLAMEVEQDGEKVDTTLYRTGVTSIASQKKKIEGKDHSHFVGLHEAIISEQERRSFSTMLNLPIFDTERIRLHSEEGNALKEIVSKKRNVPFEDVAWVGENENEYMIMTYPKQREVLVYICDEVSKELPEQYPTPNEVHKEFLRAHFTGRLLPIARLVEGVFGEGSFRTLGDMKQDKESGVLTLESLKKARARNSKK